MRRELPIDGELSQATADTKDAAKAGAAARHRLVVFTADLGYSVRQGILEIDRSVAGVSWLILLHSPRRSLKKMARSQWQNLRRNGWRWIPHEMLDLWRRVTARREPPAATSAAPGDECTLQALSETAVLRIVPVDLHAAETRALLQAFAPDLGLSLAAPILPRALFSVPRLGTLNLHKGRVPEYRGMPPAFWELWNGQK